MEWVWALYEAYVVKRLARDGLEHPTDADLERAFLQLLGDSTVTVLVQEPWQNSVRFKRLARHRIPDRLDLLRDPMGYLHAHYGGGKFKLNFHHGWHFVATQNFKPQGTPKWNALPEADP
jgi:hypothetical protein